MPDTSLWTIHNLSKNYGKRPALDGISLDFYPGEVLALLGEEGAGKSTLAKILAGALQPDSGGILYRGQTIAFRDPAAAHKAGVAAVYDEPALATALSVAENLYLGTEYIAGHGALLDWSGMRVAARKLMQELDFRIDPAAIVENLSPAEQRLVEIARAAAIKPSLLILDQPCTVPGPSEAESLMGVIRCLKERGTAVLFLTDRPAEIFQIADRAVILRNGRVGATVPISGLTEREAVTQMAGFDIETQYPKENHTLPTACLEVQDISVAGGPEGVSFDIKQGEVFCLAGLPGSGCVEIARAVSGWEPLSRGSLVLVGEKMRFSEPAEAIRKGIGMTLLQREADGSLFRFEEPRRFNFSGLVEKIQAPFLDIDKLGGFSIPSSQRYSLEALRRAARWLAGGSRQAKRIQRWLASQARLLVVQEPTRGLCAGDRLTVYRAINDLAGAGISILMVSSDVKEIIGMCGRVAVVRQGRIVKVCPAEELTEVEMNRAVGGG
ncbi:MAG: ATP-binding cassette domain-containing protein [Anaerolineaceae bacterium]